MCIWRRLLGDGFISSPLFMASHLWSRSKPAAETIPHHQNISLAKLFILTIITWNHSPDLSLSLFQTKTPLISTLGISMDSSSGGVGGRDNSLILLKDYTLITLVQIKILASRASGCHLDTQPLKNHLGGHLRYFVRNFWSANFKHMIEYFSPQYNSHGFVYMGIMLYIIK